MCAGTRMLYISYSCACFRTCIDSRANFMRECVAVELKKLMRDGIAILFIYFFLTNRYRKTFVREHEFSFGVWIQSRVSVQTS